MYQLVETIKGLTIMSGGRAVYSILIFVLTTLTVSACKAKKPSTAEEKVASEAKQQIVGGKDWQNPTADNDQSIKLGAKDFQAHCQICHGLDGQNTGVPFADKMSPPVADLASKHAQEYTDGQLKWIIDNGLRYTGMPGWKGIIEEQEMWYIVRYLRHLPPKGSLGDPAVFMESEKKHQKQDRLSEQREDKSHSG